MAFGTFAPVVLLMIRGAIANWELQNAYTRYQSREKGLRHLLWPMVLVDSRYFDDKPDLLKRKKAAERQLLQIAVVLALWIAFFVNIRVFCGA